MVAARRWGIWVLAGSAGVLVAVLLAAGLFLLWVLPQTPGIDKLHEVQQARPSVLLSADGVKLSEFSRAQQEQITLAQVSPHVVAALIATEDARFHEHHGIDVYRTLGAAWRTLCGDTQGGSTLTQQLARNLFPEEIGRSRTLSRKAREWITAVRIERSFSKQQILQMYLNTAPFLYNVVGIEMAARTYFDKPAAALDVAESATLIGMLKGTHYYNPIRFPERALKRRNVVLAQMVKHQALEQSAYQQLSAQPLTVQLNRQSDMLGDAPHFAMHLRKILIAWADEHDLNLYTDGLVVQTTLDSRLQQAATQAVQRQADALQAVADVEWSTPALRVQSGSAQAYAKARGKVQPFAHFWQQRQDLLASLLRESADYPAALKAAGSEKAALQRMMADGALLQRLKQDKTRLEAGFVAMDPSNGEVRAWVGSRGFDADQFDHVALAARQPGSTFKPFVYGAALEAGIEPERTFVDEPVEIRLSDGTLWKPTDMSGPSYDTMSLRDGLIFSKNTITAQVAQQVGVDRIVATARALGVDQSRLDAVPSLALGTSPVTLKEMVAGYATIANKGAYIEPFIVTSIEDRNGKVLESWQAKAPEQAMQVSTAQTLVDVMRGVIDQGTGAGIRSRYGIQADVAGKTGTTQDNTDGWFILMHPQLVAGAWVGFNDNRITLSDYWGQGAHSALPIVGDFFAASLRSKVVDAQASFEVPKNSSAPAPEPGNPVNDWFNSLFPSPGQVTPPSQPMTTPDGSPIPGVQQMQSPAPPAPQAMQPPPTGVVIPAQPAPAAAPPQFVVVPGRPVTPQERGSGGGIPIIREIQVPEGANRP